MAARENNLLQGRVGQPMNGGDSPGGLTLGGGPSTTDCSLGLTLVKLWDSSSGDTMWRQEPADVQILASVRRLGTFGEMLISAAVQRTRMSSCALSNCYRIVSAPRARPPLPLRHAHHRPFCRIFESLKLSSVGHGWWKLVFRFYRGFRLACVAFASP